MMRPKWGKAGRQPARQKASQAPLFVPKFIVPHFLNQTREERGGELEKKKRARERERERVVLALKNDITLPWLRDELSAPKHNMKPQNLIPPSLLIFALLGDRL